MEKTETTVKYRCHIKNGRHDRLQQEFNTQNITKKFIRSLFREENFPDEAGVFPPSKGWRLEIERVTTTVEKIITVRKLSDLDKWTTDEVVN